MSKRTRKKVLIVIIGTISTIAVAAITGYVTLKTPVGDKSTMLNAGQNINIGNNNVITTGSGDIQKYDSKF